MNFAEWKFRSMSRGEINVDPIEGEFFTTEALGSLSDALVREAIQNSLDAAAGDRPVMVRFSFLRTTPSSAKGQGVHKTYFTGLAPHLKAKHSGLQGVPSFSERMEYILIEDYNTHGLRGDIHQYDDLDDQEKNDFYYFWRNIGRTRKKTTDLGRWGLGKTVFQAASRINTFFGVTVRGDDQKPLLMGQSVLKIHKVDGVRYAPYGYFSVFKKDFPLPIDDEDFTRTFLRCFKMDRIEKPGLSIMIPYPDDGNGGRIDARDYIRSIVRHYFFPILSGDLSVEVRQDEKIYRLDATSLIDLLKKNRFPGSRDMLGLVNMARWAIGQTDESFIRLKEPEPGKAPKLREHLFEAADLDGIRETFAQRQRLALQVPVSIRMKGVKEFKHTGFKIFLERDENIEKAEDHFIRQGITIPEVTSLRHKGIRAIVAIMERDLSGFLGDAENPAHTEWERNSKKFKKKYRLGPSTLDYIKTSPREIVKILTKPKKGRDEDLLSHLFALPTPLGDEAGKGKKDFIGNGESESSGEKFVEVIGSKYLQLNAVKDGFSLTKKPNATKVPRFITIRIAYEVSSGNPFKKYTPLDFELSGQDISLRGRGVKLLQCKENMFQVEVLKGNFKVVVKGFDMRRDLRVKTNP